MRIYLIGYMYSGKTTIGRSLAQRLDYQWLDLDQQIELTFHTSIPIFFKRYGEEAFRKIEQTMLHRTSEIDNAVISTGGGTPCHFDNMEWINQNGHSVYFDVSADTLLQRAANSRKPRPVLAGMSDSERSEFISQQLQQRLPFYQKAQIIFPADNPNLDQLEQLLRLTV